MRNTEKPLFEIPAELRGIKGKGPLIPWSERPGFYSAEKKEEKEEDKK